MKAWRTFARICALKCKASVRFKAVGPRIKLKFSVPYEHPKINPSLTLTIYSFDSVWPLDAR
jgi:hypothetical protein